MADIDPQEFGRLQAEVATLRRDTDKQTAMLESLVKDVAAMREQMAEARGGWKLMMMLGGGAATLGSGVTWIAQHFIGKGPTP